MQKILSYFLLVVASLWVMPMAALADDEIIIETPHRGIPVQTAILTRRYGAIQTEPEVAARELEAGYGETNTFKFVRWYRPYYGGYYGYYGPRYYAAYRPRYYGYYGYGGYGPYGYGGYGYGPAFYPAPYAAYYAPPMAYGAYYGGGYGGFYGGGYGGCYYW